EVLPRDAPAGGVPLAVVSRTWDPDVKCLASLLFVVEPYVEVVAPVVEQLGFRRLGPGDMPVSTFVRL
ncbi:MAG: hypothetical protein NTU88_08835, partial [Armatimonadetes bacterium]|nr:hypothetical protein [Armatimonadota bacterium]